MNYLMPSDFRIIGDIYKYSEYSEYSEYKLPL